MSRYLFIKQHFYSVILTLFNVYTYLSYLSNHSTIEQALVAARCKYSLKSFYDNLIGRLEDEN